MVLGLCKECFTVENEESEKVDDDDGLNPKAVGAVLDTARIRDCCSATEFHWIFLLLEVRKRVREMQEGRQML
jgi:hypothetical protein